MTYRRFKFYVWLNNPRNICFLRERTNFISLSRYFQNVRSTSRDDYDILDILGNDQDANYARLEFVQKYEPTILYMYLS